MRVTRHLRCMKQLHRTRQLRQYHANCAAAGTRYDEQVCSIAGTLEVVGERWTLLIIRDVLLGLRRFDEFQSDLGIARNVLQSRLEGLVSAGIFERRRYQERPERYEYFLTEKGLDLWPTLVALMQWGDVHAPTEAGPPVLLEHRDCGGAVDSHRTCARCGEELGPRDVLARPGPGATDTTRCGGDRPARGPRERVTSELARGLALHVALGRAEHGRLGPEALAVPPRPSTRARTPATAAARRPVRGWR